MPEQPGRAVVAAQEPHDEDGGRVSSGAPAGRPRGARSRVVSQASPPVRLSTNSSTVPIRNSGTASPRYHRTRSSVLWTTFRSCGSRMRRQFHDELRAFARAAPAPPGIPRGTSAPARRRTASAAPRTRCRRESRGSSPAAPSTARRAPAAARRSAVPSASRGSASSSSPSCRSPSPSTIGRTALPLSPIDPEDPVAEDGQARDVAGVLEHAEDEEERGDDRQHDGDRVGEPHRDEAVLAHEKVPQRAPTARRD